MLNRCIFWIFVVFSLVLAHTVHAETKGEKIGTIVEIEGTVTVTPAGGTAQPAKIQDEISENDIIATGPNSRAFILLIDDTEWTLSENTRFKVTDYLFNPDDSADNSARYSVLEGAFRYVSGLVAKKENPDVSITTPVGTIGIRGTDIWSGKEADGRYGVYVNEGQINVKTMGGQTMLKRDEGATLAGRDAAPGRPGAWNKQRLDFMLGTVHLQREGELKQRRLQLQERRKEMREKYRESMKERFQQLRERRGDRQQKMEQRQEKMQDMRQNWQERKGGLQDRRQQQLQNFQARKGQWQEKKEEQQENREEKREEFQENHPQLNNLRQNWQMQRPLQQQQ